MKRERQEEYQRHGRGDRNQGTNPDNLKPVLSVIMHQPVVNLEELLLSELIILGLGYLVEQVSSS